MPSPKSSLHVYAREINTNERNSLTLLASWVEAGADVLDLGCGSGALGRHLHEQFDCQLDGVTINDSEAELARPFYDRVEVADLDQTDLPALFSGRRYDRIICADVLEHLKQPERILQACRELLKADGELLISIPNVAYAGLVAELLEGRFAYREEGLLDQTHLRFFTRQSLLQFLGDQGYGVLALDTVVRELHESEFHTAFDRLPPAVARFLLAVPDALTYQLIVRARPGLPHASGVALAPVQQALAHFSMRLYLGGVDGYREERKLDTHGVIGDRRQTLSFRLPEDQSCTALRLDPADRPGFLHLYRLSLRDRTGLEVWRWQADRDPIDRLASQAHHEMLIHSPTGGSFSAQILLYGDDPWMELPVGHCLAQAQGGSLEVELGWPMSADYLCLSDQVKNLGNVDQEALQSLRIEISDARAQVQALQNRWNGQMKLFHALEEREQRLSQQHAALLESRQALRREQRSLQEALRHEQLQKQEAERVLRLVRASPVFRLSRPLAELKAKLSPRAQASPHQVESPWQASAALPQVTVDIIVPVYKGLADTQRCIRSVLSAPQSTPYRLIIVNDCSPEPEVTEWLRQVAQEHPSILLLENAVNLGFVATVNRGMECSDQHDVLLLNSDTEVANDWLDRLCRAAHVNGRVGTVTPFSNNATICSYPRFCAANDLPAGYDTARLDALFAQTVPGLVVDVPTGVGFCMYIRRDCLSEVGLFDVATFGMGYGEENDFCRRAHRAGWRNLHALDTFVRHAGGVSFGASKSARELAALKTLQRLYPDYDKAVQDYIELDPARQARLAVDQRRLAASGKPVVLAVMHNRGGGTVRHALELAQHLAAAATFFMLRPIDATEVSLEWVGNDEGFECRFRLPSEFPALLQMLRDLGVCHVHYHHLIGHSEEILHLANSLGVDYDFTAHDYYSVCPQVSLTDERGLYCGEAGSAQCNSCVQQRPAPGNGSIEDWRRHHGRFLEQARHVLTPSADTRDRLARYLPQCDLRVVPHTDLPASGSLPIPAPHRQLSALAPLKVVVLGALSSIKGADLLESVALAAAQAGSPLEFHLLGYAYRPLTSQPKASLTVHGAYDETDLPRLLNWLQPDLVWFPALWPETYSYTLSAALMAGLPVLATDLGAFSERLSGRPWSWVHAWNAPPEACLQTFLHLREQHFLTGVEPPPYNPYPALGSKPEHSESLPVWRYETDYLQGLKAWPPTTISAERMYQHRPRRPAEGKPGPNSTPASEPLNLQRGLRAVPGFFRLARLFPVSWREAVKRPLKL